jgi:hypothetical protein
MPRSDKRLNGKGSGINGTKPVVDEPASSKSAKPSPSRSRSSKQPKSPDSEGTEGNDNATAKPALPPAQSRGKPWYARNDNRQRSHTKHRRGAIKRLGVAPEQLHGLPSITHLLEQAEGGIATVFAALRLCDDSDAQRFLDRYERVSVSDREYLSLEEICVAAEVAPKRLLEMAVSALVEDSQSAGRIIAATYHPRVIKATAQAAMYADGHQDRKLFLSGSGFVPQAPNRVGGALPSVIINNQLSQGVQMMSDDPNARFNAAEEDLKLLHEQIDGTKLLQAPKQVANAGDIKIGHVYQDAEELECIPRPK